MTLEALALAWASKVKALARMWAFILDFVDGQRSALAVICLALGAFLVYEFGTVVGSGDRLAARAPSEEIKTQLHDAQVALQAIRAERQKNERIQAHIDLQVRNLKPVVRVLCHQPNAACK